MRIIVSGARDWTDRDTIASALGRQEPGTTVVAGGAPGADELAVQIAADLGFGVELHEADWRRYGKAAGPIRNQRMVDSGAELVLAFHPDLSRSRGTVDLVERARDAGIPVTVLRPGERLPAGEPLPLA